MNYATIDRKIMDRMISSVDHNQYSLAEKEAAQTVAAVYNARGAARLADATEVAEIEKILHWTGNENVNSYSLVPLIWKYQNIE